jgi:hypothetical protein
MRNQFLTHPRRARGAITKERVIIMGKAHYRKTAFLPPNWSCRGIKKSWDKGHYRHVKRQERARFWREIQKELNNDN